MTVFSLMHLVIRVHWEKQPEMWKCQRNAEAKFR